MAHTVSCSLLTVTEVVLRGLLMQAVLCSLLMVMEVEWGEGKHGNGKRSVPKV